MTQFDKLLLTNNVPLALKDLKLFGKTVFEDATLTPVKLSYDEDGNILVECRDCIKEFVLDLIRNP